MLKILYAAEEEKVDVGQGGELTITGPDGNAVTTAPDDVPANDPVESGNPDEEMNWDWRDGMCRPGTVNLHVHEHFW